MAENSKIKLTFDATAAEWCLQIFDMHLDHSNYIVKDGERVKDMFFDEEIHIDDLGGITKEGLFKGDLSSIMKIVDKQKGKKRKQLKS